MTKNSKHRLLLVEPSFTQAKIITRFLSEAGFIHVQHSKTGEQAIELCQDFQPSIILSALYLKDLRADKLAISLYRHECCERTPFILISSEHHPELLEPIRQSGIHSILPKPFERIQLQRVLQQAVEYVELTHNKNHLIPKDFSVLVTDDSSMSRKYISTALNKLGINNIFEASNVDTAIQIIEKNLIQLIISDYTMPQKNGMRLLQYTRKESLQPAVPFLLISANVNNQLIKHAYANGITNILAKPFSFREFQKIIEEIIQQNILAKKEKILIQA